MLAFISCIIYTLILLFACFIFLFHQLHSMLFYAQLKIKIKFNVLLYCLHCRCIRQVDMYDMVYSETECCWCWTTKPYVFFLFKNKLNPKRTLSHCVPVTNELICENNKMLFGLQTLGNIFENAFSIIQSSSDSMTSQMKHNYFPPKKHVLIDFLGCRLSIHTFHFDISKGIIFCHTCVPFFSFVW